MADFIYNRAYRSGGRWHLVEGEVEFETIPASERVWGKDRPGEGQSRTVTPEHRVAKAKVRCGVATDSWSGSKGFIETGTEYRDDWSRAWRKWNKDRTQEMVVTQTYTGPLVVLDADVPPEPLCGHCDRILEKEANA